MVTPQLIDYIKTQLNNGFSRQDITQSLITQGWQSVDINEAFNQSQPPTANNPTPSTQTVVTTSSSNSSSSGFKIIIYIIIGVLILALAGVATYFGYGAFVNRNSNVEADNQTLNENQPTPTEMPAENSDNQTSQNTETSVYTNQEHGFSITPPTGWTTDESGILGMLVVFYTTENDYDIEGNAFRSNINIATDTTSGLSFEDYIDATKEQLPLLLQNYRLLEEATVEVDSRPGKLLTGTFTQGVFDVTNYQLIVLKDETVFVVTASTLSEVWDNQKDTLKNSLLTLKLN